MNLSISRDGDSTVEKMRMGMCPSCKHQTVLENFCFTSVEKLSTSLSGGMSSDEKDIEQEIETLRDQLVIVEACKIHLKKKLEQFSKDTPKYSAGNRQSWPALMPQEMKDDIMPGDFDAEAILESFKNVSKIKLESCCLMNKSHNTRGETERLLKKYKESLKATYFIEFNQELRLMMVYSNISKQIDIGEVEWDFCWTRSFRSMEGVKLGKFFQLYITFRDTKGWLVIQANNLAEAVSLRNVIKATIETEGKKSPLTKQAIKFMVSVQKQGKVRLTNRLVVCSGKELRFFHKPGHFMGGGKPSQVIDLKHYESPEAMEAKFINFHVKKNRTSSSSDENRELRIKCRSEILRDELLNLITNASEEERKSQQHLKKISIDNRASLVNNLSMEPKKRVTIAKTFVVEIGKAPTFTLALTRHKTALDGLASGKTNKKKNIFKEEELKLPDEQFVVPEGTNRIFWFMRKIEESIKKGSFLSPKLHISSSVWTMRHVPIKHYEEKLEMFDEVTREVSEAINEIGKPGAAHGDVLDKLQNKLNEHREKLAQSLPEIMSDETSASKDARQKSMAAKFWQKVARKIDVDTRKYVDTISKFCALGVDLENVYNMFKVKGQSSLGILENLILPQVKFFVSVLVTDTMEFLSVYLNQCQHDLVMN